MYELSDEQISYEEYQELIKALKYGIDKLLYEPGSAGIYGFKHLRYAMACLNDQDISKLLKRYHETSELPQDQYKMNLVWDEEIEYKGVLISLRYLILELERLWNQFNLLQDSGV